MYVWDNGYRFPHLGNPESIHSHFTYSFSFTNHFILGQRQEYMLNETMHTHSQLEAIEPHTSLFWELTVTWVQDQTEAPGAVRHWCYLLHHRATLRFFPVLVYYSILWNYLSSVTQSDRLCVDCVCIPLVFRIVHLSICSLQWGYLTKISAFQFTTMLIASPDYWYLYSILHMPDPQITAALLEASFDKADSLKESIYKVCDTAFKIIRYLQTALTELNSKELIRKSIMIK